MTDNDEGDLAEPPGRAAAAAGVGSVPAGDSALAVKGAPASRRALVGALALLGLLPLARASVAQSANALPWKSGSFAGPTNTELSAGSNPSPQTLINRIRAFDSWRGRRSTVALQFISFHYFTQDYPAFLQAPALRANLAKLKSAGYTPVLSIPLVTARDAGRFSHVAAGGIDRHHGAVADRLRQIMGLAPIYFRLGWECDHGYPWSITGHRGAGQPDPALPGDYKRSWRRIAKIYRNNVPGAVLVWNTMKNPPVDLADYYPGDDVVDIISIDLKDNGSGGYFTSNNTAWMKYGLGSYDATTGLVRGMRGVLELARARGKKTAVDEWGVTNRTLLESDRANNGFFVSAVYDFMMANSRHFEYEIYFNLGGEERHQIYPPVSYNLRPSTAYRSLWRP